MTSEEAIREYMRNENGQKKNLSGLERLINYIQARANLPEIRLSKLFKTTLYVAAAISVVFLLLLFYILSVSIDRKLQQRAIDKVQSIGVQTDSIKLGSVN